ncbi:MAG: MMPL family transporter [Treponema sp.]|nr:MMPL family transporter [Treponema sp.]
MNFVKKFFKHPWIIIVFSIALTGFLGFFLKDLTIENTIRMFFPKNDESYTRLTKTEDEFGSMISLGISIEAKSGSILTPENIQVIKNITDQALKVKYVEDVDSLTHIDYVCNQDGAISASQLIPDEDYDESGNYIGSKEMLSRLKDRLNEWDDIYSRVIIDDNYTGTQIQVTLEPKGEEQIAFESADQEYAKAKAALKEAVSAKTSDAETIASLKAAVKEAKKNRSAAKKATYKAKGDSVRNQEVLDNIRAITEKELAGKNLTYKFYGDPSLSENSKSFMLSDLTRLIPLVAIVLLITLYFSFHTLEGTFLPLLTVLMATVCSCGLMALLHETFTLVSSVIPVALIASGSAYGIHVLTHYYNELNDVEGELTKEIYEDAVFRGLKEVSKAVLLAALTTAVGFASLVTSPIECLHSFAVFMAIGVVFALLFSVIFIPALILVKPYKLAHRKTPIEKLSEKVRRRIDLAHQRRGGKTAEEASGETTYAIYRFFCGTPARLIIFTVAILTIAITGFRLINIDTALVNYFPRSSEFRQNLDYVDEHYAGTNSTYFLISGKEDGDVTNPELLTAVDEMQQYLLSTYPDKIGKIASFTTFIKRVNQVWHDPATAEIAGMASGKEDESGISSFGDDAFASFDQGASGEAVSSFGEDAFASFGDGSSSAEEVSSFGDDAFASFGEGESSSNNTEEGTGSANPPLDFVDPNIAYKAGLEQTKTAEEILSLLNAAYIEAGGKNASFEKVFEQFQKQLNYKGLAYYEIPGDVTKYPVATKEELQDVVNDYMSLLSGSLDRFVDKENKPSQLRIQCQLRTHATADTGIIIEAAKEYAKNNFPEGYTIDFTGSSQMEYAMTNMIVSSQITSLSLSLGSVFLIIAISFGSVWAGLLGVVPLALTILLNYMVMGFAGINLDFITSIIASVAVGVGIDYTIHFLTTYKEERSKSSDIKLVTMQTFKKSGKGIVTNALSVGLGFLVLCLSKFSVLRCIGVLVAIVMFSSSVLAMTIIPGILNWLDPAFIRPKKEPSAPIVPEEEEE